MPRFALSPARNRLRLTPGWLPATSNCVYTPRPLDFDFSNLTIPDVTLDANRLSYHPLPTTPHAMQPPLAANCAARSLCC